MSRRQPENIFSVFLTITRCIVGIFCLLAVHPAASQGRGHKTQRHIQSSNGLDASPRYNEVYGTIRITYTNDGSYTTQDGYSFEAHGTRSLELTFIGKKVFKTWNLDERCISTRPPTVGGRDIWTDNYSGSGQRLANSQHLYSDEYIVLLANQKLGIAQFIVPNLFIPSYHIDRSETSHPSSYSSYLTLPDDHQSTDVLSENQIDVGAARWSPLNPRYVGMPGYGGCKTADSISLNNGLHFHLFEVPFKGTVTTGTHTFKLYNGVTKEQHEKGEEYLRRTHQPTNPISNTIPGTLTVYWYLSVKPVKVSIPVPKPVTKCPNFLAMQEEAKKLNALADSLERDDLAYGNAVADMFLRGYDSPISSLGLNISEDQNPEVACY